MTEYAARAPGSAYGRSAARWADELEKAELRVERRTERYWQFLNRFTDRVLHSTDVQGRALLRERRKLKNRLETAKHSLECVRRITRKLKRVYWLPELGMPKPPGGQESRGAAAALPDHGWEAMCYEPLKFDLGDRLPPTSDE